MASKDQVVKRIQEFARIICDRIDAVLDEIDYDIFKLDDLEDIKIMMSEIESETYALYEDVESVRRTREEEIFYKDQMKDEEEFRKKQVKKVKKIRGKK